MSNIQADMIENDVISFTVPTRINRYRAVYSKQEEDIKNSQLFYWLNKFKNVLKEFINGQHTS